MSISLEIVPNIGDAGTPCGVCGEPKSWRGKRYRCQHCQARRNCERKAGLTDEQREVERIRANDLRSERRATWTPEQRAQANAQVAAWREANREQHRAGSRASYARRADEVRATKAAEYQADPSRFVVRALKRKALLRGAICKHGPSCVTAEFLAELYAQPCRYCGDAAAEADHFTPLARGGLHCQDNLVPACQPCNRSKYAHDPAEWLASRES